LHFLRRSMLSNFGKRNTEILMTRKCHIEASRITAVWTHVRLFLNLILFTIFMFKCLILLLERSRVHIPIKAINVFVFCVFLYSFLFFFFKLFKPNKTLNWRSVLQLALKPIYYSKNTGDSIDGTIQKQIGL
jgi:hypothetical protein